MPLLRSAPIVFLAALLVLTAPATSYAQARFAPPPKERIADAVAAAAARDEPVEALILLDDAAERQAEQDEATTPAGSRLDYAARIARRIERLDTLKGAVLDAVASPDLEVLGRYSVVPVLHVRLTGKAALQGLSEHAKVLSVDENLVSRPMLAQSLPLIGQPQVAAQGARGAGTTIAVLDTGVDYTREAFGPCTAPNQPAATCKVAFAADFAPDDGLLDGASGHGTNVAAVALGVAPDARIAALDVFRSDGLAYSSDIISAIDWSVANRAQYNIVAMNMSLGGGRYDSPVPPLDAWGTAIQRAIDAGIIVISSAGNAAYTDALSLPGAYTNVVSVGAVYDADVGPRSWTACSDSITHADRIACWSNSANFLDLLAPGAILTAAGLSLSGTSQAAPHVAGAAAVLRGILSDDPPARTAVRLRQGPGIMDHRNGLVRPRLDLVSVIDTLPDRILVTRVGNAGGGSVNPPFGGAYASGTSVTVTATPSAGYSFSGWSGDCSGASPQCTVVMNAHRDVTAHFQLTPVALSNGQIRSNLSAMTGQALYFSIDVPADATALTVRSWGGTGDADLYVRRGALPTTQAFDCRPFLSSSDETCSLASPAAGTYYIMLRAFSSFSGVSLQASYASANLPVLQFGSASYSVLENIGTLSIPVIRSNGSTDSVAVQYATANGTALAGADYEARNGTLSFGSGVTMRTIDIPIINDLMVEGVEHFRVDLGNPSGAVIGAIGSTTVTIVDDDSMVEFESPVASVTEALGSVTVWVRRIGNTPGAASVRFATSDGTAVAPGDYAARSGTLHWATGDDAPKSITVPIVDDTQHETPETFRIQLSQPSGTTLGPIASVTVSITDNDMIPRAQARAWLDRSFDLLVRALRSLSGD